MLLNKFACCLLGDDTATRLSKEVDEHPHPHPVSSIGPPSWAPKPLLPSSTVDPSPRSRPGPESSRQSISYPTFGSDSLDASEDETPIASPERTRNSLQRFHHRIVKRLSHSLPPVGSQEKANDSQNTKVTRETVERRQELKRALRRRVEEELLQEKAERPEKKCSNGALTKGCPQVDSDVSSAATDPQNSKAKHRPTGSMSSKKSLKSILEGLPTVAEHPDTTTVQGKNPVGEKGKEVDEDGKSATASSWYTDKPSTEALSKKASQIGVDGAHVMQAPGEPVPKIPELPEVFAKLKKTYARRSASINGEESIYRPPCEPKKKTDGNFQNSNSNSETTQAVDDIFKPLDHSPQRLGLWTTKSKDDIQASKIPPIEKWSSFGHDGASTGIMIEENGFDKISANQPGPNTVNYPVQSSPTRPENKTREIALVEAKNSLRTEASTEETKIGASKNLHVVLKRIFGSSLVGRLWNTGHDDIIVPAMSLPSLRNGETSQNCDASPKSFPSFRTAPANLHGARSVFRSRIENLFGEPLEDPKIDDDDPFVEKTQMNSVESCLEVPTSRRKSQHQHSTSMQSETESFRAREIAAVSKRIVSQRWKDHPGRKSRFKEMLGRKSSETNTSKRPERIAVLPLKYSLGSFDGPEDPEPKIKRSYTVSDYIKAQNSAGTIWERALQEHAFEMALKNSAYRRKNTGIGQGASKPAILTSRDKGKSPFREDMKAPIRRQRSEFDHEISPGASPAHSVSHKPSKGYLKPTSPSANTPSEHSSIAPGQILGSSNTPDSWSRFPSHTRVKRTGAAGAADSVSSFDFGEGSKLKVGRVETADVIPLDVKSTSRVSKASSQKLAALAPVIALPGKVLKIASQMRKTVSMDIRRSARRGMRSSVSTGGRVKAPELELLGLSAPTLTTISDADAKELEKHSASLSSLPRRSDPSEEEINIGQPPAAVALPARRERSTRVLTKRYQDLTGDNLSSIGKSSIGKKRETTLPKHKAKHESQVQGDGSADSPSSSQDDRSRKSPNKSVSESAREETCNSPTKSHVKEVIERLEKKDKNA